MTLLLRPELSRLGTLCAKYAPARYHLSPRKGRGWKAGCEQYDGYMEDATGIANDALSSRNNVGALIGESLSYFVNFSS